MKRTYDPRKVKRHRSYSVKKLAALYGVTENTVRRWINKHGLPTIPDTYPVLMHWQAIRKWMTKWQEGRRWSCAPDQMSCLKCQGGRHIRESTFWVEQTNAEKFTLHGDCEACGNTLNRYSTKARLDMDSAHFVYKRPKQTDPSTAHTGHAQPSHNTTL